MANYRAPIRDMRFVLHELLDVETQFSSLPGYEEASADVIDAILEEGAKICEAMVVPTNHTGDTEGCKWNEGNVTTPSGFKEAYQALQAGGWLGLDADTAVGGQGLPGTIAVFFEEILQSSNLSLSLYQGLTRGACKAVDAHGSQALKATYLPNMVEGKWSGVMCLTESHCGTDLGLLRTKAEPNADGSYRVSGTKIFITGGDQDLTENIVHLVLARLPDAPPGVKGISMLLVPKFLVNEDGSLGSRNAVNCGSIEHKMGINGASTCVMNYEQATGYLVGEPHRGLRAMFSMMNHERLMVGQQGLALAEIAYQNAVNYARERMQGRSLSGAKFPDQAADPIIVHPDIRRMLLNSKACIEGGRALLGWVSMQVEKSEKHPDANLREEADDYVALLIPVVKAFFSDMGSEVCNACQQVFGGHGYISEWGMEQLVRDVRIAQIYEGANGIHALDLVGRKLPMHGGRLIRRYMDYVQQSLDDQNDNTDMQEFVRPLGDALARLKEATRWIESSASKNPDEVGASSYDYLRLLSFVAIGVSWVQTAAIALDKRDGDNTGFYDTKLATARFYMKRLLPQTKGLADSLSAGSDTLMAIPAESF